MAKQPKRPVGPLYNLTWECIIPHNGTSHYYEAKDHAGSVILAADGRLFFKSHRQKLTHMTSKFRYSELQQLVQHVETTLANQVERDFDAAFAKLEEMK